VKDEGCGIPPENLARVFEPMFTSKPFGEGTGLGLSIVHDIVTGHFGGEIHVQSEVGKGTTVDVALPRAEAAPGRGAKVPA
jgi:signal transduction histidine kinase